MRSNAAVARRDWVVLAVGSCLLAASAIAIGCSRLVPSEPPPVVKVMVIQPRPVSLYADFVGQVSAYQEVELRSMVGGILKKCLFRDGETVKKGQLLYVIDNRPYLAALDDAKAQLAQSEASLLKAEMDVERYTPLFAENAIPKQTLDNAVAQQKASRAEVDSRRAAVRQAELNLEDCTIEAPLTGQIGLHKVDVGGLVTAGTTVLATLSLDNPAYAYFSISEQDYIRLYEHALKTQKKHHDVGSGPPDTADQLEAPGARLFLSGDLLYPEPGQVDYLDRAVSPSTGTLTVRALFANPSGLLKPGLYVKVRLVEKQQEQAILVPQKAVQEVLGQYFLAVVGQGDLVENRPVKLGVRQGPDWLVKSGVNAGERIVVEGLLKARPGSAVKPVVVTVEELAKEADANRPGPAGCAVGGAAMSQFFIDRPIFAIVVALVITLAGPSPASTCPSPNTQTSRCPRSTCRPTTWARARTWWSRPWPSPSSRPSTALTA